MKKPYKILLDARMVHSTPHGIALYVLELLRGIKKIQQGSSPNYELVLYIHADETENPDFKNFKTLPARFPFLHPFELFEIPRVLRKEKIDLYHSPSFSSLFYSPCPTMVTVHDLNHLYFGNTFQKFYYRFLLKPFIKKSLKTLSVSKFSQNEIAEWSGLSNEKIELVYNSVTLPKKEDPTLLEKKGLIPKKYFLCISNAKPHKNTEMLLHAFQKFNSIQGKKTWPLVISHTKVPAHLTENVISVSDLTETHIATLMKNCAGFFFPSLYEGFGRPPLEAALAGAKVVCSDIPPHHEIWEGKIKNIPLFLDPTQPEQWTQALLDFYQNKDKIQPLQIDEIIALEKYYHRDVNAKKQDSIYSTIFKGLC